MTIETWKQEFYPKSPTKRLSKIGAIEHSLRKWEGLTSKNLKKHKLHITKSATIADDNDDFFIIDSGSCALCEKYFDFKSFDPDQEDCEKCPLFTSLGNIACDKLTEQGLTPYREWMENYTALPMIRELKKTLKMVQKQEKV